VLYELQLQLVMARIHCTRFLVASRPTQQVRNKLAIFPSTGCYGETCAMDFGLYSYYTNCWLVCRRENWKCGLICFQWTCQLLDRQSTSVLENQRGNYSAPNVLHNVTLVH